MAHKEDIGARGVCGQEGEEKESGDTNSTSHGIAPCPILFSKVDKSRGVKCLLCGEIV